MFLGYRLYEFKINLKEIETLQLFKRKYLIHS